MGDFQRLFLEGQIGRTTQKKYIMVSLCKQRTAVEIAFLNHDLMYLFEMGERWNCIELS